MSPYNYPLMRLITSFSAVSVPLHAITSSGKSFQWGKGKWKDFIDLEKNIIEAPILELPNFQWPFEVDIDVSGYVM